MLPTRTRRRPAPRRGTILLVVLTLLALFAVIGLSFAFYAESQATASRIAREARARIGDQLPPDPTEGMNLFLGRLIYPVGDTGTDLLVATRGHELARLIFGNQPGAANTTPYNGEGLFHEDVSAIFGLPPGSVDRASVVNFTYYQLAQGNPATGFVFDPEHTQVTGPTTTSPFRKGDANTFQALTNTTAYPNLVYVGKNAPYTYPDRNNMAVAVVDPNTGLVVVPSFHRPSLFRDPSLAPTQSDLDPANSNWYTPLGRFKLLRPRPIDHLTQAGITTLQGMGLWPIPVSPSPAQIAQIQSVISNPLYCEFPYPAPNPDGTITGDVQNMRFANGLQRNDSPWLYAGLPVYNWRGKRITPLVAPLVVPIDGRINLNAAGNIANSGTIHNSNMGFGPWEQSLQRLLTTTSPNVMQTKYGGATTPPGVRTGQVAFAGAPPFNNTSKLFHPDWNNPTDWTKQVQPPDYARVDWNWSSNNSGTAQLILPGTATANPLVGQFGSNPVWPNASTTLAGGMAPTPYPGPYDNSNYTPASAGPPPTPASGEVLNHPGTYTPYFYDPLRMSSLTTDKGSFPLFDLKRFAGRYSDKAANYTGQTFLGKNFPNDLVQATLPGPNNPANSLRQLVTPMSNSFKRPILAPNFFDPNVSLGLPGGARYPQFIISGTGAPSPPPAFNIATIANSLSGDAQVNNVPPPTGPNTPAIRHLRAAFAGIDLHRPLTDYRIDPTQPLGPANINVNTFAAARNERQALAKEIFLRLAYATGAKVGFDVTTNQFALPQPTPGGGPPYASYTLTGGTPTPVSQAEYDALRWLAQLAANIVDYIDEDDISSTFVWNPIDPNDPFNVANFATTGTPSALSQRVVFGVEKPRLVINEAYAELANDPADKSNLTATAPLQVRFFLELLNPNNTESNAQGPLAGPDLSNAQYYGSVPLRYNITVSSVYQIKVFDDDAVVANDLAGANAGQNVTGSVTTAPARLTCTMVSTANPALNVTPGPGYLSGAERVEPNNGAFSATATARNGFAVIGPQVNKAIASDGVSFTPDTTAAPYSMILEKPIDPAHGQDQLLYQLPGAPPLAGAIPALVAGMKKQAVVLQRLACPYLPANDPASGSFNPANPVNPYITVDYQTGIPVQNAVKVGSDMAQNPPPPAKTNYSIGRVQPFTASGVPALAWTGLTFVLRQKDPSNPNAQQVSFFKHNSIAPANAPPTVPGGVLPTNGTETLLGPFEWLVHMDRRLVNPMELLHVSTVKPHELTHRFAVPNPNPGARPFFHRHDLQHPLAPLVDPPGPLFAANSPLYRGLEVLAAKPWGHGLPEGGRVPGKVNINMIWDENPATGRSRVFDAVMDRQAANTFTDTGAIPDLTIIWNAIKQSRSPQWVVTGTPAVGMTYDEGGAAGASDRPLKPFGAPIFSAGVNIPQATDIGDTILRNRPTPDPDGTTRSLFQRVQDPSNPNPLHPYLSYEPLRKAMNSFTTVSDNYVVLMTVGFFEVRAGDPANPNNPVVLGKEAFDQVPGDMRSQFVAVIDRTRLVAQYANTPDTTTDPTVPNNPNSTAPWVSELQAPFTPVNVFNPNVPSPLRFLGEVEQDMTPPAANPGWDGVTPPQAPVTAELRYSLKRPESAGSNFYLVTPMYTPRTGGGYPPNALQTIQVNGHYDGYPWTVRAVYDPNSGFPDPVDPKHGGSRFFLNVGNQVQLLEAFYDPGFAPWSYDPVNGIAKIYVRGINMSTGARTVPFRAEVGMSVSNVIFGNPGTPGSATTPFNMSFDFRQPLYRPAVRYVGQLNITP
jgi:hypothetical protein